MSRSQTGGDVADDDGVVARATGEPGPPNAARMYDVFLGGAHSFAVDRDAAARVAAAAPHVAAMARANRGFLMRAVRYCVTHGVGQFLDLGSGIPTMGNVHEIARTLDPGARVAYVDADPIAVAYSRDLLAGVDGVTITRADLRDPATVLAAPTVTAVLDVHQPVAVLLVGVLHFIADTDDPAALVAAYRDATIPGSVLALSHASDDYDDPDLAARMRAGNLIYQHADPPGYLRDRAGIAGMLAGITLVDPGLVDVNQWRAGHPGAAPLGAYGAVGHTP